MSIDIGDALSRGFEDLTSDRGVSLLALYVLYNLTSTLVAFSFAVELLERYGLGPGVSMANVRTAMGQGSGVEPSALALDLPLTVTGPLLVASLVAGIVVRIVSIRAFASESTDPIPTDEVTRHLGRTIVFYVVAITMMTALMMAGLFAIIVGALVVGFLLYFVDYAVIVDDEGPVEALGTSYELVTDDPIEVLVLIIALAIFGFLVTFPVGLLPLGEPVNTVLSTMVGQVVTVFSLATLTDAYLQARGPRGETA